MSQARWRAARGLRECGRGREGGVRRPPTGLGGRRVGEGAPPWALVAELALSRQRPWVRTFGGEDTAPPHQVLSSAAQTLARRLLTAYLGEFLMADAERAGLGLRANTGVSAPRRRELRASGFLRDSGGGERAESGDRRLRGLEAALALRLPPLARRDCVYEQVHSLEKFFGMGECSAGRLDLTEQTPILLGSKAMAASLMDVGDSFVIADQRHFVFPASRNKKLQGHYSVILPSSRYLASQKGNTSETIVIDDEEDMETNGREKTVSSSFIEWGFPGTKNRTKDLDFSTSSLSRSKTKTAVGPFNPGRMNVAGGEFQNGGFTTHHSPDSWISQSASFPRNQKQPGVDSLSPVASLPKQIFQSSAQQQPTKAAKITCANCKKPLQKGQTAYQRKGSAHLFCSTTCLSSFSHKRTPKKRNVTCKKDAPTKKATVVPQGESSEPFPKCFSTSHLSPYEDSQNLRKRVLNKSRCTICNKLTEIRHEVSVNNVTHKLCSNQCFNKYRLANGLVMNCCEQCGEYLPGKGAGNNVLVIEGQQMRFCCQSCVNEYKQTLV
ncbi:hypothetical protein E5288_WYG005794 [Bos mutus]|uniref:TRASH domain-containing protein n=1 Tax=Bos mutus TaxID=72004 RepID=A0A6B0R139_9CETA|nr:hypothetical protein [Bos mutus]